MGITQNIGVCSKRAARKEKKKGAARTTARLMTRSQGTHMAMCATCVAQFRRSSMVPKKSSLSWGAKRKRRVDCDKKKYQFG